VKLSAASSEDAAETPRCMNDCVPGSDHVACVTDADSKGHTHSGMDTLTTGSCTADLTTFPHLDIYVTLSRLYATDACASNDDAPVVVGVTAAAADAAAALRFLLLLMLWLIVTLLLQFHERGLC
jgi:hypothetical protein